MSVPQHPARTGPGALGRRARLAFVLGVVVVVLVPAGALAATAPPTDDAPVTASPDTVDESDGAAPTPADEEPAAPDDQPEPEPDPTVPPEQPTPPPTVTVAASGVCDAGLPAVGVEVDFVDDDALLNVVTVTVASGDVAYASSTLLADATATLDWPDVAVATVQVRADGELVAEVDQPTGCTQVLGEEVVNPTPEPTPSPTSEPTGGATGDDPTTDPTAAGGATPEEGGPAATGRATGHDAPTELAATGVAPASGVVWGLLLVSAGLGVLGAARHRADRA